MMCRLREPDWILFVCLVFLFRILDQDRESFLAAISIVKYVYCMHIVLNDELVPITQSRELK